jgi:hypothetical protein
MNDTGEPAKNVSPIKAPLNIYQRINEVRKKVSYAKKDKDVETGGKPYKVVTHDAITALVRNHLIDQGIVIVPRLIESTVTDIGKTKGGTPVIRYAARFEIDFVNADDPTDRFTVPMESHANDSGDKAPGKATSYATKYAMLKLFSIETGEDDEGRVEPYEGRDKITEKQAADLNALLDEVGADREAFMEYIAKDKFIASASLEEIPVRSYSGLVKMLERKRKQKKPEGK